MLRMISLLGCLLLLTISLGMSSALAVNKVLSLDGDGDYVEVPDSDELKGGPNIVKTVEAFFYLKSHSQISEKISPIVGKALDGEEKDWVIAIREEKICFWSEIGRGDYLLFGPRVNTGVWYHVAIVVDQLNSVLRLFLNGILAAQDSNFDNHSASTSAPVQIGITTYNPNFVFKGSIDEVRVWNIIRTQEAIQDAMNRNLTDDEIQSETLVGYWNFDSGIADDLSQYENHGALKGDAYIADVIYVSPDGSPTGDGTKENPYDTIQRGIDESGRNDIVQVLPGTYEENITLYSDLIVFGSGAENTTITAESGSIVTANNVHNVNLSGFTIDGQGSADNGILCSGTTSEMEISSNVLKATVVGIKCSDSVNVDIKNNTIEENVDDGIWCIGSAHANIKGNTISQNGWEGIECRDSTNIIIDDNHLENNGRYGIWCMGEAIVSIINNDIRNNEKWGIRSDDTANVTIQYNMIDKNGVYGIYCGGSTTIHIASNNIQYNSNHGIGGGGTAVVTVCDNLIHNNRECGMMLSGAPNFTIVRNTILGSASAIDIREGSTNALIGGSLIDSNNIMYYRERAILNRTPNTINATYNYWGTTDEAEIAAMMRNEGEGSIIFKPFINTLDEIIADVSGDGTISALDAALILQYVIGLIDKFPATSPISQAGQKYISGEISVDELDRLLQKWGYPSVFKLLGLENQLLQNYPNPFNPDTWIPFKLARNAPVTINIYDVKGQLVRTLHIGNKGAGIYVTKDKAAYWDGRCRYGEKVASGVYFYHLKAGDFSATRRMLIAK